MCRQLVTGRAFPLAPNLHVTKRRRPKQDDRQVQHLPLQLAVEEGNGHATAESIENRRFSTLFSLFRETNR